MSAWSLADLVVGRRGAPLDDDPVAALFSSSAPAAAAADVVIDVRASAGPVADPGGEPRCFHGDAKVRAVGDDLVVFDGSTRLDVRPAGLALATPADPAMRRGVVADVTLLLGLILALRARHRFHLHAGLLSRGDDGVLVVGTSGAGKTTTCLALQQAGHTLHGDDVVFVGDGGRAWALPRALHVGAQTARAFPDVAARLGSPLASGKRPLALARASSPGVVVVRRLVLPAITPVAATTTAVPDQAEVFGALLEAGAFVVVDGLPGADAQLALLAGLAALPATALSIGRDALDDGGAIARALEVAAWR